MLSLATKVKQVLINRSKPNTNDVLPLFNLTSTSPNPQAPSGFIYSDTTTPNPSLDKIIPIPTHITDALPQELYESFIRFLQDDIASLRACSLVCTAWTRTSQRPLFLLLVRPYQLSSRAGFRFKDPVRCAVVHEKTNAIYYGTSRGVYSRSLVKPDEIPVIRLSFADIRQMNIVDHVAAQGGGSVLIFRSAGHLYTIELQHLQVQVPPPSSKERPPKPLHWSRGRELSYYSTGLLSGHITVAAVNSTDVHLLRLGHVPGGVGLALHGVFTCSQIPASTPLSLFGGHIICTHPTSGFERRDPTGLASREMLPKLASGPAIQMYLAVTAVTIGGGATATATVTAIATATVTATATANASASAPRTTYMVLCYDSYAIYMDDRKVLHGPPILWRYPAKEIYFQNNHAYIISSTHLEIHPLLGPSPPGQDQNHSPSQNQNPTQTAIQLTENQNQNQNQNQNEAPIQLIEGKFRVLSGKPSSKIVILREDGYIYGFRSRQKT